MGRLQVVACGDTRVRVGPWRGEDRIAHVAPFPGRPPARDALDGVLTRLTSEGYRRALTSALTEAERAAFLDAGFEVQERLHLLRAELGSPAGAPAAQARLRRGRRWDRTGVLAVDQAAFAPFWQLDADGLRDALSATPSVRFRVAPAHAGRGGLVGYAICGRAGTMAYLQRLAVHPAAQGRGVGTALVADALAWARRRGAVRVLVNTQEHNGPALRLYERVGFVREEHGLAVLARDLQASS
jgi:[ribosomal protein S18]-alanine N-acetyltransferase